MTRSGHVSAQIQVYATTFSLLGLEHFSSVVFLNLAQLLLPVHLKSTYCKASPTLRTACSPLYQIRPSKVCLKIHFHILTSTSRPMLMMSRYKDHRENG